jgi:propionyl-CoA synthetase
VARLPMPPGCMTTLYGADQRWEVVRRLVKHDARFEDTYFSTFPGYYDTMDAGVKDEYGYIKVTVTSPKPSLHPLSRCWPGTMTLST